MLQRTLSWRKAEKNVELGVIGYREKAVKKAVQYKAADHDEKAFEIIAFNTMQNVKDAWMVRR